HRDKIVLAGGLRPNPGEWYCGGLWVMEVENRADAARLCEEDPYFRLGLRKGYRLCVWGKAPPYQAVTLSTQAQIAISSPTASTSGSRGNRTARPFKMRSAVHAAAQASTKSSGPLSLAKPRHVVRNSASYPFRSSN